MKQKNVKIKNKKYYSKAQIDSILANYNFLISFSAISLINNENYFNYDKLVDFIHYCKFNNKYTSLINKIYYNNSCNSFRKAAEVLVQNGIAKEFTLIDQLDSNKNNLILFITDEISLSNFYTNEEEFKEMYSFVSDYNRFIYDELAKENDYTKKLAK